MQFETSTLLIVNDVEATAKEIQATLPKHSARVIRNEEEGKVDFLIAHARLALKEAYIASENRKYILLCGNVFTVEAQNALLKALEEPPKNIIFILITNGKSGILKTVFSRLPHKYLKTKKIYQAPSINLAKIELKELYDFLKLNQRIGKAEAKELIESLLVSASQQKIPLSKKELEVFGTAMKLCELNSRPINILTTLLLTLMRKR